MTSVFFHSEATAEFRAAVDYYEKQRPGLGIEFLDTVERAVQFIAQTPQAFPPYGDEGLRRYIIRRFPYTIFYLELETALWIAAVAHHRRRPSYWLHRRPE